MGKETTFPSIGAAFPTTRWTRLVQIRESGLARSKEDLQALFTVYLPVVHGTVLRDWTRDPDEAADLTQEFFLNLLETDFSRDLSPDRGRFRHFVKAALKNFLLNRKRNGARLKRGGGAKVVSIDDQAIAATGEDGFDREWARCLLATAMEKLRELCATSGRDRHFQAFQLHYRPDDPDAALPYPAIAEQLGIPYFDVGNHVKWARAEFRRIILELIADYAGSPEAARRELEELFQ